MGSTIGQSITPTAISWKQISEIQRQSVPGAVVATKPPIKFCQDVVGQCAIALDGLLFTVKDGDAEIEHT